MSDRDAPRPDVTGRLLEHIEVLQQLGTCCRLGLVPDENLLARLRRCDAWTGEIKAARRLLTSADGERRWWQFLRLRSGRDSVSGARLPLQ